MPTLRDVKSRIGGVQKIEKVTKAMQIIASIKLNRCEKEALRFRPYGEKVRAIFSNLSRRFSQRHPLLSHRDEKKSLFIALTSDRGFCGSFNINVYQSVAEAIKEKDSNLIVIGKKGSIYFKKRPTPILSEYSGLKRENIFAAAEDITKKIVNIYKEKNADRVYIYFNRFRLHLLGKTEKLQLLPVEIEEKQIVTDFLYEPSTDEFLDRFIPEYITTQIIRAILESQASEEMARMVAMKYATDNAEELIDKLSLDYHKARQAAITRELIEIVGGGRE